MSAPSVASRETVDPALIAWYRQASATKAQFQGLSVINHAKPIRKLIQATGATRLLDYGCGLGNQYSAAKLHEFWGVPVPALYDPGVVGLETKPAGSFHGVICSDVLEHVPEALLGNLLAEVFGYAERFVWMSVCCRPAKKSFPDGRNLHVTVRDPQWWTRLVRKFERPGLRTELIFTP